MENPLLLASDANTRTGLELWLPLATAVIGGVIAGWFGGRNARKSPHDRLKTLVDIAKHIPEGIDVEPIHYAIDREIHQIEKLMLARRRGFLAYTKELFYRGDIAYLMTASVCGMTAGTSAVVWLDNRALSGWIPVAFAGAAVICSALFLTAVWRNPERRPD